MNQTDSYRNTSLHCYASKNGSLDIIRLLLDKGTNINETNNLGLTPLYYATLFYREEIVKELLKHNVDLELGLYQNNYIYTPLHIACIFGYTSIVKLLLDQFQDFNT